MAEVEACHAFTIYWRAISRRNASTRHTGHARVAIDESTSLRWATVRFNYHVLGKRSYPFRSPPDNMDSSPFDARTISSKLPYQVSCIIENHNDPTHQDWNMLYSISSVYTLRVNSASACGILIVSVPLPAAAASAINWASIHRSIAPKRYVAASTLLPTVKMPWF